MTENPWRCTAAKTNGERCAAFAEKGSADGLCGVHRCLKEGLPVGRGKQLGLDPCSAPAANVLAEVEKRRAKKARNNATQRARAAGSAR